MEVLTPSNIISVVALLVAGSSFIYTRRSVLTADKPYLRSWLDGTNDQSEAITLWIENKGNAPAIVKRFHLQKPEPYSSDEFTTNAQRHFAYYFQKQILDLAKMNTGFAIAKCDVIPLVRINLENLERADRGRAYDDLKRFKFFLNYTTLSGSSSQSSPHFVSGEQPTEFGCV